MDDILFRKHRTDIKNLFRRFGKKAQVYLKASKTVGSDYDPLRDEGYTIEEQNPIYIRAWLRTPSPDGKMLQEIGTIPTGTKELIVFDRDINTLKISDRIVIEGIDYTVFNDALGNRFTILERIYGIARIVIWRKDGDN